MDGYDNSTFPELVTIPEAARRSGLGLRQFRRAILNDELPVFDVGDWPRVRWRDVLQWVEGTRRNPRDRASDGDAARERGRPADSRRRSET
jgi:hypothetical protein